MEKNVKADATERQAQASSRLIDWYSEGETRVVEVNGVRVAVRFVGRKGRRGRILIEAPAGAVFESVGASAGQPHSIRNRFDAHESGLDASMNRGDARISKGAGASPLLKE